MTHTGDLDLSISQCSSSVNLKIRVCIDKFNKYIFCCIDSVVRVYDIATGECLNELNHPAKLIAVHLNPSNFLQLLTSTATGEISLWNYEEGTKLKSWNLNRTAVGYFPYKKNNFIGLVVLAGDDVAVSAYQLSLKDEEICLSHVATGLHGNSREISCDLQGNYFCYLRDMKLFVQSLIDRRKACHVLPEKAVCVTCHPSREFIATGDLKGAITLWHNFFDARPVKRQFHWHSSAVEDIAFPTEGSSMYSGGVECVAVKWSLQSSQKQETKEFLSRLDGPINSLAPSPDNKLLAVVLDDNSIRIATSQMKLLSSIRLFARSSWFRSIFRDLKTFPIGLHYDSNGLMGDVTRHCLVANAMPGHLQFYNPKTDRVTYSHDVINRNLPPKEAGTCGDVVKVDFQDKWMATVEYRRDAGPYTTIDFALKFWYYDEKSEKLELNAAIEYPHQDRITSLKFRPVTGKKDDTEPTVVTTSVDGSVKVWTLTEAKDVNGAKKLTWLCDGSLNYRKKPARCCQFSKNGKVLCLAFDGTVTFWNFDGRNLLVSLQVADDSKFVEQIEFGQSKKDAKLICCLTKSGECSIWDVDGQIRLWNFDTTIYRLVVDKNSGVFAAFSPNTVFYFKPSDEKPIACLKYRIPEIFGACFAKSEVENDALPPLYVLCHDHTIYRICTKAQQEELCFHPDRNVHEQKNLTALATALTETRLDKSAEETKTFVDTRYLDPVSKLQMLNAPAHTLPNIQSLGLNFIKSCLQPKVQNINEPKSRVPVTTSDETVAKVEEKCIDENSASRLKLLKSLKKRKFAFLENYFQSS